MTETVATGIEKRAPARLDVFFPSLSADPAKRAPARLDVFFPLPFPPTPKSERRPVSTFYFPSPLRDTLKASAASVSTFLWDLTPRV